jgi:hypothetical protein
MRATTGLARGPPFEATAITRDIRFTANRFLHTLDRLDEQERIDMPRLTFLIVFAWAASGGWGCAASMQGASPGTTSGPRCLMGSDGVQACGYACQMGADGVSVCANTPDGVCDMGADGHVTCSQVQGPKAVGQPPPECKMGTRGENTCGYNCRMGSNGVWYCASMPNGQCAMNANGTWTCP